MPTACCLLFPLRLQYRRRARLQGAWADEGSGGLCAAEGAATSAGGELPAFGGFAAGGGSTGEPGGGGFEGAQGGADRGFQRAVYAAERAAGRVSENEDSGYRAVRRREASDLRGSGRVRGEHGAGGGCDARKDRGEGARGGCGDRADEVAGYGRISFSEGGNGLRSERDRCAAGGAGADDPGIVHEDRAAVLRVSAGL